MRRARRSRRNQSHPRPLTQKPLPVATPHPLPPPLLQTSIYSPSGTLDSHQATKTGTTVRPAYHPPKALLTSPSTHNSLRQSANLLHLLHARNKNQHRRSPFYRHFDHFRRQLRGLLSDLAISQAKARRSAAEARISFWLYAGLVTKWYVAFSQLFARESVRFAGMGMALLGILARVSRDTGATVWLVDVVEREQEEEMVGVLEKFAREQDDGEDEGVVVPRGDG